MKGYSKFDCKALIYVIYAPSIHFHHTILVQFSYFMSLNRELGLECRAISMSIREHYQHNFHGEEVGLSAVSKVCMEMENSQLTGQSYTLK